MKVYFAMEFGKFDTVRDGQWAEVSRNAFLTLEEVTFARHSLLLGRRLGFLKEALCTLGSQVPGGLLLGDPASGQLFDR